MIASVCKLLAVTAVSSAVGYCFYFDNKRRSDPDYKKKVHDRRLQAKLAKEQDTQLEVDPAAAGSMPQGIQSPAQALRGLVKTNTEHYFLEQITMGDNRLMVGDIDGAILHMINATSVCTQQETFLNMLQGALPQEIFSRLMARLQHDGLQARNTNNVIVPDVMSSGSGQTL